MEKQHNYPSNRGKDEVSKISMQTFGIQDFHGKSLMDQSFKDTDASKGKSKNLGSKYRHRKDSLLRKSKQKFSS